MTTKQALDIYNKFKVSSHLESDLRWREDVDKAVLAIQEIGTELEEMGARLQSRQVIATIIYFAENQSK